MSLEITTVLEKGGQGALPGEAVTGCAVIAGPGIGRGPKTRQNEMPPATVTKKSGKPGIFGAFECCDL